jgi:hypothetical protein
MNIMRTQERTPWIEFDMIAVRRRHQLLYVTLNPKGEFVLSLKTYREMKEPPAVVLLYDRTSDTIGLRPASDETRNAIVVRTRHSRYNRVVRSLPFLREHGIELTRTIQFPTARIDAEGVLCLPLRERIAAGHMPWKKNDK